MNNKICKSCGESKSLSEYYPRKDYRDGLIPRCKTCESLRRKEYRIQNEDAINEARRKLYSENIESRRERARKYCADNKEDRSKYVAGYYEKNRERFIKKREERKLDSVLHKKDITKKSEYRKNHLEERKANHKRRMKTDNNYVTIRRLRGIISAALTRNSQKKNTTT